MADILATCPTGDRRIGKNSHAYGWTLRRPLDLPPLVAKARGFLTSDRRKCSSWLRVIRDFALLPMNVRIPSLALQ
jgi:phosphoketolase